MSKLEPRKDTPVWTLAKGDQRLECLTRVEATTTQLLVLRNGRLQLTRDYDPAALGELRADLEAMRAQMMAYGWKLVES